MIPVARPLIGPEDRAPGVTVPDVLSLAVRPNLSDDEVDAVVEAVLA